MISSSNILENHPALKVDQLQKQFGKTEVLRGVNLTIETGAIHGLVGLNGAGKTTALQCILGLQAYNSGEVRVLNFKPNKLFQSNGRVAVVFDEPCLHGHLTVSQVLELAQISSGLLPTKYDRKKNSSELEELLGITKYHNFKIRNLSLGNRRRTSIAQALVGNPKLIILDEPFNGLDAGGVDDVLALIKQLNQEKGITFLLASHQLSYLEKICSHMAFLHHGKIIISDTVSTLLSSKRTRITLNTNDNERCCTILAKLPGVREISLQDSLSCELEGKSSAEVNRFLIENNIDVFELVQQKTSLENLFRELTRDS
ncbi:ABC transporter ATP-binding protein [Aurantivibrio infirmus]